MTSEPTTGTSVIDAMPSKARLLHLYPNALPVGVHAKPGDVAFCGHVRTLPPGEGRRMLWGIASPDACVVCDEIYQARRPRNVG